jgi:hypothetical protein
MTPTFKNSLFSKTTPQKNNILNQKTPTRRKEDLIP